MGGEFLFLFFLFILFLSSLFRSKYMGDASMRKPLLKKSEYLCNKQSLMIKLINKTGSTSKIGYCVQLDPRDPNAFVYAPANATKVVGVVMEKVPYRKLCKIAVIGEKANVYVSGKVVKGDVLRTVKSGDRASLGTAVVAKVGDAPYFKIGEALNSGRGLISCILELSYLQSDPELGLTPQQTVSVAKSGGDFTSIQAAIDSIIDASITKRYAVIVYPGDYIEHITMKDYVDIVGTGRTNSRIVGTSGTVLTFPATKGTVIDMGIYIDYGTLGADSTSITSAGADCVMIRCDIGVTKSGGDFVMHALSITAGAFRMSDCYFTYSITGATTDSHLIQSAIIQSGILTTFLMNNNEVTITSDDTNDDLVGFETTAEVTGIYLISHNVIHVDAGAAGASATGLWLYGTATGGTVIHNRLVVNCNASAYGLWIDSAGGSAVVNSRHNSIIVTAVGAAISAFVDVGDTWNSSFDRITANSGYDGTGTINYVNSTEDGQLDVQSIINGDLFITRDPWFDVRAYDDIADAVTTIGATEGTLLIPDSNVLGGDLIIPATLTLKIIQGGSITTTGHTLTINGPFEAGLDHVFVGTGTVVFGVNSAKEAYPQWWGGTATYGTDQTDYIEYAVATGLPVFLSKGVWQCNLVITPTLSGNLYGATTIKGAGISKTFIYPYANADAIQILADSTMLNVYLSDFSMENRTAGAHTQLAGADGIHITTDSTASINDWHVFKDIDIAGFKNALGIVGRTIWSEFTNIRITHSLQDGVYIQHGEPSNGLIFKNVAVQNSQWSGFFIKSTSGSPFNDWVFELCTSENNGLEVLHSKNCGFYLYDVEKFSFLNPSIEINGVGTFDDSDAAFIFEGTYALNIHIYDGFVTGSNSGIFCRAQYSSGLIENCDIRSTDASYHCIDIDSDWTGSINGRWYISKTNRLSPTGAADAFSIAVDGNGNYQHYAGGENSPFTWWTDATTPTTLNLYYNTDIKFNVATAVTVNALLHSLPGQRITIDMYLTSADVTLDSGIMRDATSYILRAGDMYEFVVDTYPNEGKLLLLNKYHNYGDGGIPALADSATPTITSGDLFLTGGTTTITNFVGGREGQIIRILSEHTITITDGTNIFLNGSANFVMASTDSLTLVCKADGKWYELARSVN
jgi:hypothetical protein